jgi:alkylation response protein AidB-like acyl-CoA dehydrogenase
LPGDRQRLLAKEGIQIHGGIGYTWEHDMHLYVKRMKSGEALFGTSGAHRSHRRHPRGVISSAGISAKT